MNSKAERRVVVDRRTAETEAVATVVAESTCNSVRKRRILIVGRRVVGAGARCYTSQIDFTTALLILVTISPIILLTIPTPSVVTLVVVRL